MDGGVDGRKSNGWRMDGWVDVWTDGLNCITTTLLHDLRQVTSLLGCSFLICHMRSLNSGDCNSPSTANSLSDSIQMLRCGFVFKIGSPTSIHLLSTTAGDPTIAPEAHSKAAPTEDCWSGAS